MIADEDRHIIKETAAKYHVKRVILFGSSLSPEKESRDIDIGVEGVEDEDFFAFYGELICALSKPVDIVDLSTKSRFVELIEREGIDTFSGVPTPVDLPSCIESRVWRLKGAAVFRHDRVPACLGTAVDDDEWRRGRVSCMVGWVHAHSISVQRTSDGIWTLNVQVVSHWKGASIWISGSPRHRICCNFGVWHSKREGCRHPRRMARRARRHPRYARISAMSGAPPRFTGLRRPI